jgi:hypothetical protein
VTEKAVDKDQKSEESKVVKAADKSADSSESKKPFEKAADKSADSSAVDKAVTPKEKSAEESGASSGAPQLHKSIKLINSAKKHLVKAYEGGSDTELDIAGNRIIEAKTEVLKAMKAGETVPEDMVKSLDRAASYYGKALASFENDNIEEHVKCVEKAQKHMLKAVNAYELQKSQAAVVEKSVTATHKDGKVTMEMTAEQFKGLEKALAKENLYKSFTDKIPAKQQAEIDAVPILKSLVSGLNESFTVLKDNLQASSEKEGEFKKSVSEAIGLLAQSNKQLQADVEKLKDTPNVRKSVVTEVKSPLDTPEKTAFDASKVEDILNKGVRKGICSQMVLLAWDVDKDMIGKGLLDPRDEQKYINLCEKIERS